MLAEGAFETPSESLRAGSGCLSMGKLTRHHTDMGHSPDPRADRLRRYRMAKPLSSGGSPPARRMVQVGSRKRKSIVSGPISHQSKHGNRKFTIEIRGSKFISLVNSQIYDGRARAPTG